MKNLKNSIRLLGLFIFLIGSQPVFAQGNAHAEKDKKEQTRQEQKEKEIRDSYKQKMKNAKGQEKKELEEELERELQQFQKKAEKNNKFDNGQSDANNNQKKAKKNKKVEKGQPDSKDNQGNAYGKNKGGLEGREFGQARAADARAKVDQYNTRLTERRQIVILGKRKIEGARIRLEEYKKNNILTPEEIAEREARVVIFERKLNAFDAAVEEAIRKNEAKREQLVLFYVED